VDGNLIADRVSGAGAPEGAPYECGAPEGVPYVAG